MTGFTSRIGPKQTLSTGFAAKVARDNALVYDLRVTIGEGLRFFILKILPTRHDAFLRALKENKGFDLKNYGEILHMGDGEPSDALKEEMHKKYGLYS